MKDSKQAEDIAKGIITYLKSNKKEHLLGLVIEKLEKNAGIFQSVQVFVPTELTNDQKGKVENITYKLIGTKKVKLEFIIDKGLIDGLKIVSGDKVWDFSMASQIEKIRNVNI